MTMTGKEVFPLKKKFDGDWYFFEEFMFSKEEAQNVARRLIKAYPSYKNKIKARVVKHGNDKLWAVYIRKEK
jgi:ABC-type Zn uptake system ZnuABC Zn-binding protein ZnuA